MRNAARFMGYAAMAAMLATGAACRDDDGGSADAGVLPDGGGNGDGGGGGTTIYDVQDPAKNMPEGTEVKLEGVIVTAIDLYGTRTGNIYVQEPEGGPYSGVLVFRPQGAASLQVGDIVTVEGGVKDEFICPVSSCPSQDMSGRALTEITAPQGGMVTVTKTGTGTVPPPPIVDPEQIATDDVEMEKWEGVPITVQNVAVTSAPAGFGSTPSIDSREMTVTGPLDVQSSLTLLGTGGTEFTAGTCLASLTGIVDYFFNYHLYPRSDADFVTGGTDCPAPPTGDTSIVSIQDGTVATGTAVSIEGAVVTAVAKLRHTATTTVEPRVWIADAATGAPLNGILVFRPTITGATIDDLVPGDIVNVTGTVVENFDETQIGTASLTRTGTGPAPTPVVVPLATLTTGATAEPYEGVLVTVENVAVTSTNPDTPPDDFDEWTVGTPPLRIDNVMLGRPDPLSVGDCYTRITGVLGFAFGNYKLEPRSMADLVKSATPAACQ